MLPKKLNKRRTQQKIKLINKIKKLSPQLAFSTRSETDLEEPYLVDFEYKSTE